MTLLVIDVEVTDPDGNISTGSVTVTVNDPAPPAMQAPPASPEPPQHLAPLGDERLAEFQRRSLMYIRGGQAQL